MRKISIFSGLVCLLLGGWNLSAGPVSVDRVLDLAGRVLTDQKTRTGAPALQVVWDGEAAESQDVSALYVVSRESGGFIIIAGDDRVYPVLAISDKGSFKVEGMPDNVRWWMDRMKAYVRSVQTPEPRAAMAWSAQTRSAVLPDDEITDKVERLTPEWDQGNNDVSYFGQNVFNAKCPKVGNELAIVGCTATALAEVLTYESGQSGVQMPSAAHGVVERYTVGSGYTTPSFPYQLGTVYDWEGLRTLASRKEIRSALSSGNTALLNNMAQLMADLGAIIHASYSVNATSAHVSLPRLIEHFDINKQAHTENQSAYPIYQWVSMLRAEIDRRPVLYSGRTQQDAGHQFILDGYGKLGDEDVFHINFGWSGYCNGYYRILNLDTGDGYDYSYSGQAVFDFYPDASSTYKVSLTYASQGLLSEATVVPGQLFNVTVSAVMNRSSIDFSGSVKYVQEDKSGNLIKDQLYSRSLSLNTNTGLRFNFNTSVNELSFGDKIVGFYKVDDTDSWERIPYAENGGIVGELPLMPAAFICTQTSYAVGDYFDFRLRNNAYQYAGTIWTITDPNGQKNVSPQSDLAFKLTIAGKYKIEAAVAPKVGGAVTENLVTYITVK